MAIMEIAETAGTFGVMLGLIEVIKTLMKRKQNGKAVSVRCVSEPMKAAIYKTKTDVEWLKDMHTRTEKQLDKLVEVSTETQVAHMESKTALDKMTQSITNLVSVIKIKEGLS